MMLRFLGLLFVLLPALAAAQTPSAAEQEVRDAVMRAKRARLI